MDEIFLEPNYYRKFIDCGSTTIVAAMKAFIAVYILVLYKKKLNH
jgi:hypothetical protein